MSYISKPQRPGHVFEGRCLLEEEEEGQRLLAARLGWVVAPQSSTASCQTDEIMISAYCTGTFSAYPLVPLTNGARCGANPNSTTLRVTIVCAKR